MTKSTIEITLDNFLQYQQYIGKKSGSTIKSYKENIGQFIRHVKVGCPQELTFGHVQRFFLYGNKDRKWKSRTFRKYYMSLVVFFDWLVEQQHLPENFVRRINVPELEDLLPRCITQEQAKILLVMAQNYPFKNDFIRSRSHAVFATFMFAGLRKDELFKLKRNDVDIDNRTLFVQGKGKKERIVPISNKLAVALSIYIEERNKLNKTTPYFFVSFNRDCRYTDSGLKRIILLFREVCGFHFTAHMLRHTFATLMLRGGCDIYTLSRMMGHSDIKITTSYTWLVTDDLRIQLFKHPLEV